MGLTKREYIATHVLPAIIEQNHGDDDAVSSARTAVEYADALVRALDARKDSAEKSQAPSTGDVTFHPSESEVDRMERVALD